MAAHAECAGTWRRGAWTADAGPGGGRAPGRPRGARRPAVSEGVPAKPNENASAVPADPGGDSPTDSAALGLAEQAAGAGDPVVGVESEPHLERPGEAGTTEDLMQPGAAAEEAREETAANQDLAGQGQPSLKNTPGGAKPSEVNADESGQPK